MRCKRWLGLALVSMTVSLAARPAHADYDSHPDANIHKWFLEKAQAGVKAASKPLLKAVGKALVEYFSPSIAELIFGGGDGANAQTKLIIDEIHAIHEDLAERHRVLLDEVRDEHESGLKGRFKNAVQVFHSWINMTDPMLRLNDPAPIDFVALELGTVRAEIEEYIDSRAEDPRGQHRRLQLLEVHIVAAQMEMLAWQVKYDNMALMNAFQGAHPEYGVAPTLDQYNAWRESLTEEEMEAIQASADAARTFPEGIALSVLEFYERTATIDDERAYVDDIFTPVVSYMDIFNGNRAMYDSSAETNDRDNWGLDPDPACNWWEEMWEVCGVAPQLDGPRYYYYVNVPNGECLDGYVGRGLVPREGLPWTENVDTPSASECNRYWVATRDWYQSSLSEEERNRGSFENYDQWFEDSFQIWEIHKEMVHGDMLLANYGAISLILDNLYEQYVGGERPRNNWDDALDRYDELNGLLSAGNSYVDAVAASARLADECDATIENVGLGNWFDMLQEAVAHPDDPIMCQDALESNNSFEEATRDGAGYYRYMNLNTPNDVDIVAFDLLADNSVLVQWTRRDGFPTRPDMELYLQGVNDEEPQLAGRASYDATYGWSIRLPETEDGIFRHQPKVGFVKVYSESGDMGSYELGIQTRGPRFQAEPWGGSSGDGEYKSAAAKSAADNFGEFKALVNLKDIAAEALATDDTSSLFMFDPSRTIYGSAADWIEPLFPDDGIEWVPESSDAYRLVPLAEDPFGEVRSIQVKGMIHTGGDWITNHFILGQTRGADLDRFVVEVPAGYRLDVTTTALLSGVGLPYHSLDTSVLRERASTEILDRQQYETASQTHPNFGCSSHTDVEFSVQGLFNDMYRKDTGPYGLSVQLVRHALYAPGWAGDLCTVRDSIGKFLWKQVDPSDLAGLEKWEVYLEVVDMPDKPYQPYVLRAVNKHTGKPIATYEVMLKDLESPKHFKHLLAGFNAAEMGAASFILRDQLIDFQQKYEQEPPK